MIFKLNEKGYPVFTNVSAEEWEKMKEYRYQYAGEHDHFAYGAKIHDGTVNVSVDPHENQGQWRKTLYWLRDNVPFEVDKNAQFIMDLWDHFLIRDVTCEAAIAFQHQVDDRARESISKAIHGCADCPWCVKEWDGDDFNAKCVWLSQGGNEDGEELRTALVFKKYEHVAGLGVRLVAKSERFIIPGRNCRYNSVYRLRGEEV